MLSERAIGDLQELYAKVHRKIVDGRAADAIEVCETIVKMAADLGDELTVTHYPTCEPCAGTAEIGNPAESDRKVRCQDMAYRTGKPGECLGNRYGRMHPTQLQDYVLMLATPKVVPIHDSEGPGPEPETPGEMQPTRTAPSPYYVYDREAVIRFNDLRVAEQPPIPIPEDDEEVLAHADGTFTVRKKNGA
jgi:hypothetical protein